MERICIGTSMRLDECMNYIAKGSGISNPMNGIMPRTLDILSKKMSDESLGAMLNDYVDLLNTALAVIPGNDDGLIDFKRISRFFGSSSMINGESVLQHVAFLLYDCKEQRFQPIYVVCSDGSEQFRFHDTEKSRICDAISSSIDKRNYESEYGEFSNVPLIIYIVVRNAIG